MGLFPQRGDVFTPQPVFQPLCVVSIVKSSNSLVVTGGRLGSGGGGEVGEGGGGPRWEEMSEEADIKGR